MKSLKLLFVFALLVVFSTGYAQDSTQTEINQRILSAITGNTKILITGYAMFGFSAKLNNNVKTDVKNNFDMYGFSPMFLWKLSNKVFFESEIEIINGEMELEYAKLSYSLNKYMIIGAGRMLSPFGAYGERWESSLIERFPNSHLRPDDGLLPVDSHLYYGAIMGVDVRGGIPLGSAKMNYALYVSNGPLLSKDDNGNPTGVIQYENLMDENNNDKEIGGRIGILPFSNSSLEIGFSGKHGIAGDQGDPVYGKTGATAYAVDFSYVKSIDAIKSTINIRGQFNSLKVDKANYYLTDSTTYTFDNSLQNYYIQFSIRPAMAHNKCLKKTELLLRYNSLTLPKDAVWGIKDNNGNGGPVTRMDIGLAYWLSWKTGLHLAYESTAFPDGTKENRLIANLVYAF